MSIYHTHHIVPRHMGGTDDPSNLVRLTIEEHAEAHKKLYEEYGKEEDRIAWLALSGQITLSEASKMAHILGSYRGGYAKKPNKVPAHNKIDCYCVGCRKRMKPSQKGHKLCFKKAYGLERTPNSSFFTSEKGKDMSKRNNAISTCPRCNKQGQYRAMKRWHFDKCKANHDSR
jgi:hypothetical protein